MTLTLAVAAGVACSSASTEEAAGPAHAPIAEPSPTSSDGDEDARAPSHTDDGGGAKPDAGALPSTGADKPNCKYKAHATGITAGQQAGGLSFHVYAPATYNPNVGHTVVILMHGQDSDGVGELTALWQPIADQEQLVLVAPSGSRPATNGDPNGHNWTVADLNDIQDLMPEIDDCYNVFVKKHILWGFSEGGFYGYLLGIGAANQFSGLAMGGANTSFARQNGYPPSAAQWKIPVSDVHGDQDQNPISVTRQDKADFEAAGHVFTLHEFSGGHSISPDQVRAQYDDLKASVSP
ncbi:alpha/beta hydrolase [Labilithrix luteola]|uniref:alpha/beta hydrolase n=1 Tax=Labilithrix luteola TaxID=1391654 RepID=UPI0011BAB746|nr:hypothetical protein [Labilithrix luteola]